MAQNRMMTVTLRQRYENMINDRMNPLISEAESIIQPIKEEVLNQVKLDFGIYDLEAKISATELKLEELKDAKKSRAGNYNNNINDEVSRRLAKMEFVGDQLRKEQKALVESVWLADAPASIIELLRSIDKKLPDFQHKLEQERKEGHKISFGTKRTRKIK